MKPRRISSAYLKLDDAEVIRAKDQRARQGARNEPEDGNLSPLKTQNAGPAVVGTVGMNLSKIARPEGHDAQRPSLSTKSVSHSSLSKQITHYTGDTRSSHPASKHAMSDAPQQISVDGGDSITNNNSPQYNTSAYPALEATIAPPVVAQSNLFADFNNNKAELTTIATDDSTQKNIHLTSNVPGNINPTITACSPTDRTFSAPSHLDAALTARQGSPAASQLRRSSRKRRSSFWKTELDPHEHHGSVCDALSTDESKVEETAPFTSDSELKRVLVKTSRLKGKDTKPCLDSGKRRKAPPKTAVSSKKIRNPKRPIPSEKSKPQSLHLPLSLTADAIAMASRRPLTSKPGYQKVSSDGQYEVADIGNDHQFHRSSTLGKYKHKQPEQADPPEQIIDIPSASPEVQDLSNAEANLAISGTKAYETGECNHSGRGKVVGEKLANALRGVGIHPQLQPAIETGLHPSPLLTSPHAFHGDIISPLAPSIGSSQKQSLSSSDAGRGQQTATLAIVDKQRAQSETVQLTVGALPGKTAGTDSQSGSSPQALLGSQKTSFVHAEKQPSNHNSDPGRDFLMRTRERKGDVDDPRRISESSAQIVIGLLDASPQTSDETRTDGLDSSEPSQNEGHGNGHTPESQRPLLSQPTPLVESASLYGLTKSILKSSIVDRNGSPRLLFQASRTLETAQSHLYEVEIPSSVDITESSSSAYDRKSEEDESSLDSAPGDAQALSKYRRDMLLQYGIEAEELILKQNRPGPFNNDTVDDPKKVSNQTYSEPEFRPQAIECTTRSEDKADAVDERPFGSYLEKDEGIDRTSREVSQSSRQPQRQQNAFAASTTLLESARPLRERDIEAVEWISSLQVAQKNAQDLLQQTNQQLSTQLAAEQETIQQVLQIYRQGCNRILDDLFQAQRDRMEMYRQQMSAVKEQHAQICQELIQGLQELDQRVQRGP